MNNLLFCSTGTMIGRINLWDETLIENYCPQIEADGFELMMVTPFYEKKEKVLKAIERSKCSFPLIHIEKEIGVYLASDDYDERRNGLSLFETNCEMGKNIGAKRAVFHLWSGIISDSKIENNLESLEKLYEIAEKHSLSLLIENVPSAKYDPITNLERVLNQNENAKFVYDMRFGALHEQNEEFIESKWLSDGTVDHIHVSGYKGPAHDFSSLRPILHLDEGIVDYENLLPRVFSKYDLSVTNEAPGALAKGCELEKINADMRFLKRLSQKI